MTSSGIGSGLVGDWDGDNDALSKLPLSSHLRVLSLMFTRQQMTSSNSSCGSLSHSDCRCCSLDTFSTIGYGVDCHRCSRMPGRGLGGVACMNHT